MTQRTWRVRATTSWGFYAQAEVRAESLIAALRMALDDVRAKLDPPTPFPRIEHVEIDLIEEVRHDR